MSVRRRQDQSNERNDVASNKQYSDNNSKIPLIQNNSTNDNEKSNLQGDRANIALLFFLYLLQGIPLGLTAAIPMLLQNRGASYKQQAEFSFAYWPFSLKLLWAPIVDSMYCSKFGRRKSWMIPTQYLIGIFMMLLSYQVDQWLGGNGDTPNIQFLTTIFFSLNFLAATQDIAVDGWALTMLKRCNVGHASTCNSVGQTAGYFLGYVAFIALESKEFCNTYLRTIPQSEGLVTLPEFLWFWGICFLITTTLVGIMKREDNRETKDLQRFTEHPELNIQQSYRILLNIMKMRPIQILSIILLTVKITFAASDGVTSLKLIDAGVPKEKLALLAIPMIPLQIVLPLIISRYTNGPKPMNLYIKVIPYRMLFALTAMVIVYFTPIMINNDGSVPVYYYVLLIVNYAFYQVFLYCMFVAVMAFFAKVSDPAVGGTYMTLLNTVCNLGGNWPVTVVLWLVDVLTWRECKNNSGFRILETNECLTKIEKDECIKADGQCYNIIDGYYIESFICLVFGLIWTYFASKWVKYLQNLPTKQWLVIRGPSKNDSKSR